MILLFSMLSLKVFNVHSSANILDCETGSKTAEYLEGQTFSLCCSLELECNRTEWTDYLGIKKRNSRSEHQSRLTVNRTDRCEVMYSVASAVTEDTGIYACYRNDENYIFDNMDVTIIEKPSGLTIQSITCSDLKDVNITFSYRNVNPAIDLVQVTLKEQADKPMACQANCSASTQICLCQIRHAPDSFLQNRNVTLRVNVTRSSIVFTEFRSINLIDFIVPSQVQDLSIFNISSTEVIVKFRPIFQTKNLIHWMFERGKVLTYHVTLFSTSPMEKLELQFNKTVLHDGKSNEFTAVWFQDLIPFTQYTLIVCCSGGGGQGQGRELTFVTNQSVPLEPPEVDNFSYMRWYDISRVNSSCVFIIIKPLQRTSRDRKDLSYKVELTTHSGDLSIIKCYSICQLCQVPRNSFGVKFWTLNRIGQSKTHTEITIPTFTDATKPVTIVEFETRFAHLNVQLPSEYHIENLTVHWCHGENDIRPQAICTDYPQHRFVSPGHRSLNISLALDDVTTDIYSTISAVRVFHLEDVNQSLHDVITTQSTKAATKSNLLLLEKEGMPTAENYIIRIFVSVQVQGRWIGMVEANCYFDKNSGHANVQVSSFSDSSGQTFLRFGQHCDRTYQFKVATFHIYDSIDVTCNSTSKLDEVNSTLESHIYQVPKDALFICLLAVGSNGQIKFLPALPVIKSSETEGLSTGLSKNTTLLALCIAAPLVTLIVLLTTGLSLMRTCQNRKSNIQEFTIKEKLMKTDAEMFFKGRDDVVDGNADITRVSDTNPLRIQLLKDSDSNQGNNNSLHGIVEKSFCTNKHQGVELGCTDLYKDYGKHNLKFQATTSECSFVSDDIHCDRLSSRSNVPWQCIASDDNETCDKDNELLFDLNQCSDDQGSACPSEASSYLKMNLEREHEDYRKHQQIPLTFCFSETLCSDLSESSFDNISSSSQ